MNGYSDKNQDFNDRDGADEVKSSTALASLRGFKCHVTRSGHRRACILPQVRYIKRVLKSTEIEIGLLLVFLIRHGSWAMVIKYFYCLPISSIHPHHLKEQLYQNQ